MGDYFGGAKITADGDAAMKLRCLLLGRKAMTNLDIILKSMISRLVIGRTDIHWKD